MFYEKSWQIGWFVWLLGWFICTPKYSPSPKYPSQKKKVPLSHFNNFALLFTVCDTKAHLFPFQIYINVLNVEKSTGGINTNAVNCTTTYWHDSYWYFTGLRICVKGKRKGDAQVEENFNTVIINPNLITPGNTIQTCGCYW